MELGCFPVSAAMVYRQTLGHHCRWLISPSVTLSVFLTLSPSTCHLPLRPPPFLGTQKEKKRKQKSIVAYYRKIIISHTEVALLSVLQIYDYENNHTLYAILLCLLQLVHQSTSLYILLCISIS